MSALETLTSQPYAYGFTSDIETAVLPKGLNEATIRAISAKKDEPAFMLDFRLAAYRQWLTMTPPNWADVHYPPINYQDISYYAAPKSIDDKIGLKSSNAPQGDAASADAADNKPKSMSDIDPELLRTFEKLGIPLNEQKRLLGVSASDGMPEVDEHGNKINKIAIDAVFDSVSIATTFKRDLARHGVIFCSFSEAVHEHPELIQKYLGSVVPTTDNYFAALNAAVFSDGSFVYVPEGVTCPMDLSTYFRINTEGSGQFERTLIICDKGAKVSYLEGCTAPKFSTNQLHAAVVELIALEDADIKYSTVQNWYAGDPQTGKGGIYNFVTKRGKCAGARARISWTQVETGSAITWKYPSCILQGDDSVGEFYSVALTNHHQQADTGTKMIHLGKRTKSRIISKGISAGASSNSYRGAVIIKKNADYSRNFTQCDSMLIGQKSKANTYPYIVAESPTAQLEHEATTSKMSDEQLFYMQQRGIDAEQAVATIVNGFCSAVFNELPLEFAAEARNLL
ncbi:MAG: Fe-S cluster assembly protein SufB, partial [Vampirovibrionales bacterium]|nr:Fe-S cluster assembly protein SufB [Vampirovibrionales bacterium]